MNNYAKTEEHLTKDILQHLITIMIRAFTLQTNMLAYIYLIRNG